jgi:hypothetical protein
MRLLAMRHEDEAQGGDRCGGHALASY